VGPAKMPAVDGAIEEMNTKILKLFFTLKSKLRSIVSLYEGGLAILYKEILKMLYNHFCGGINHKSCLEKKAGRGI
jgi:hypothetical protein